MTVAFLLDNVQNQSCQSYEGAQLFKRLQRRLLEKAKGVSCQFRMEQKKLEMLVDTISGVSYFHHRLRAAKETIDQLSGFSGGKDREVVFLSSLRASG